MGGRKPTSPRIIPGKPPRKTFDDMSPEERRKILDMCPDPNMHILMADGSQKRAGDLVVGDLVKTYHEKDLEKASKKSLVLALGGTERYSQLREQLENSYAKATLGEYKVEFVDIIKDVEKIKLTFEGSEIICSLSHKFYVNDSWKEAKDMIIGDEVSNKKLVAIEDVEDGDVVHITIEDAHTYICQGLLSHNKGIRVPPGDRLGPKDGRPPRKRPLPFPRDFVCPDPDMNILMADGSQKKAGDLLVGDLVKTYHEKSFELGDYEVEHVSIINDVEKIKLIFDKNTIICSLSHKFYVGDSWKEAKDMVIGDVVSDNKLVAIERVENGDVVHITVKDAHTYICEGLLSHNKSPRIDLETGDVIPPRPVGRRRRRPRGGRMRSCPDPSMLILMSDDTQKRAGDLVVGDLVKTNHEKSLELGNYEVEYVNIVEDVEKIKLTFEDSEIVCSLTHKFYVNNDWKEADDMVIGDVVSDKKLTAIKKVEDGDVVHITVKDAHTYICEGLLSHNKRFIRPPKDKPRPPKDKPRVPIDDLGPPPEREVPMPRERIRPITRESDPRGGAPFAPDERGMARDRFFERMFDRAEEAKQRKSMQKEERREVRQARNEERRARRDAT